MARVISGLFALALFSTVVLGTARAQQGGDECGRRLGNIKPFEPPTLSELAREIGFRDVTQDTGELGANALAYLTRRKDLAAEDKAELWVALVYAIRGLTRRAFHSYPMDIDDANFIAFRGRSHNIVLFDRRDGAVYTGTVLEMPADFDIPGAIARGRFKPYVPRDERPRSEN